MSDQNQLIYVLYDQDCPMCTFQMKLLTWLDWFNQLSFLPLNDPLATKKVPTLTRDQLIEAIHCITPENKVFKAARCLRYIGMRVPALLPMGIFLYIPGVIWVAEKIYMVVSRNRYVLSKLFGCKEACAIMPSKNKKTNSQ